MKKIAYTIVYAIPIASQAGLIYQKIVSPTSIHWGAVFIPCYVFALFGLIAVIVMEMQDNEHPNDFNF